jgi:hypothetical protein
MIGNIKRKWQEAKYRSNLKKSLQMATIDQLKITLDETKKELQRRSRK